jgi:hypothetical protein
MRSFSRKAAKNHTIHQKTDKRKCRNFERNASTHAVEAADGAQILEGKQCDPHKPSTRTAGTVGRGQRAGAPAMARSRSRPGSPNRRRGDF